MVQEPNLVLHVVCIWGLPFLAYFLGIVIRKVALPGRDSPPLSHQLLLGIPVCLVVVSPSLAAVQSAIVYHPDLGTYLFTLGVLIEQGMLLQETITRQLRALMKSEPPAAAAAG